MSPLAIYAIMKADDICEALIALSIGLWACALVTIIAMHHVINHGGLESTVTALRKTFSRIVYFAPVVTMCAAFFPNTETVVSMVTVPAVLNKEKFVNVPPEVLQYVRKFVRHHQLHIVKEQAPGQDERQ